LVQFRKDIQGLRALAVILVFLFHADSSRFSFGYLGVDIFICISGFVIIQVLEKNEHLNSQAILNFFANRMRRIYPLLVFFLTVQLMLSLIFQPVLPSPKFTLLSVLGLGNFYFARSSTDYWNNFSETPWNLHTWSIALELQFYFVLACIFFLLGKRKIMMYLIISMFFLSLAFYFNSKSASLYPYLIHERFWEFSLGLFAFYSGRSKFFGLLRRNLPISIFIICLFSTTVLIFFNDARFITLLLCYVILVFPRIIPNLLLENRFMLFLGLISYSFFMWHFLLIKILNLYFSSSITLLFIEFVLSLGLSYLSYRFIENHFRYQGSIRFKAILTFVLFFVISIFAYTLSFNKLQIHAIAGEKLNPCIQVGENNGPMGSYLDCYEQDTKLDNTLILGDSYAQLLGDSLSEQFSVREMGYSVISIRSCVFQNHNGCRVRLESEISRLKPRQIILTSNWAGHLFPRIPIFPYQDEASCQSFEETKEKCPKFDKELRVQMKALMQSIDFFRREGVSQVTVIGQSPEFPFDPKSCVRVHGWQGFFTSKQTLRLCNKNYYGFVRQRSSAINEYFAKESSIRQSFDFLNPINSLCPNATCKVTDAEGVPLYADSVHVSPRGLQVLVQDLRPFISPSIENH
jgi:peptidoglycan/LPS O-acetylase OafA/YrhL